VPLPGVFLLEAIRIETTVIRAIRKGKRRWKEAVSYGKRWLVEGFFSSFKRWFGEYVLSVKFENIRKELVFKVAIANMFLATSSG